MTAAVGERRGSGIGIGRRDDQIRLAVVNRKIQRLTDEDTFICLTTLVCDFIPLRSKVNRTGTPCSRVISPDGHCITNEKSDHASRSCLHCLSRPNVGGLARSLPLCLSAASSQFRKLDLPLLFLRSQSVSRGGRNPILQWARKSQPCRCL